MKPARKMLATTGLSSLKRLVAAITMVLAASLCFAQINLEDTVRDEDDSVATAESGFAEQEFRRGVQSYYRGQYNEAILEFEKALSYLPGEPLILEWLGKAYYKSGIEGAALQQWAYAQDAGYGGILLPNKIEIVSDRRVVQPDYEFTSRYSEAGAFPFAYGDTLIYSQPMSALPNDDGSVWVCAYGTNELVRFDVNGVVQRRVRGPVNGFDRPSDVMRLKDGSILVCESAGDRLALLDGEGTFKRYIGEQGIYDGQVVGPQYLAEDDFGNIYVTDFGNSRVVVYDKDGNSLLSFGRKTGDFAGLKSPTGIAVNQERVFVADSVLGAIYEFDRSGNFMGNLVNEKSLARPESLKNWGEFLVLTDRNKILTVDTGDGTIYQNGSSGNGVSGLTCAVPDSNGNLIVTDFKANEIYVMSKTPELVGGLFVQIDRVIADKFPEVTVEVRVENRRRQQVVGLNERNFLITEQKRTVSNMKFLGAANNNDIADIAFIIDNTLSMEPYYEEINQIVREVTGSMKGGSVQIISAGAIPTTEYVGKPGNLYDFDCRSMKNPSTQYNCLDQGIRLACNNLINGEKKRGIIFITDGNVSQTAFENYALSDLTTYMNNNFISFSTVLVDQNYEADEIDYLTESTTGKTYFVYRPEGLDAVLQDIIAIPNGLYQLSYTSTLGVEYGRKYLNVEVETYLLNRSGRDESGYFAPLQ